MPGDFFLLCRNGDLGYFVTFLECKNKKNYYLCAIVHTRTHNYIRNLKKLMANS